jgi:hypothetical protein
VTKRRLYEPRIVGGKVISADLQRLHQRLLNSAVIEVSDELKACSSAVSPPSVPRKQMAL